MRRVKPSLITSVLLSVVCASAAAQEGEPTAYPGCDGQSADTAAAKGAFQAGTAAFDEADYERAIIYWEDAYRRDCTAHALLKNLARAYELNGMFKHAIFALRTYAERDPSSSEEESLERRIENLEAKLKETSAAPPHPVAVVKPANPVVAPPQAPPEDAATTDHLVDEPSDDGRSKIPLVVAGVGAVAAGVGGALWLDAKSREQAAADKCVPSGDQLVCSDPTALKDGQAAQDDLVTSGVVTLVGAGALVGGLIWYFAQPDKSELITLAPAVAPGFAGLSYSGSF